MGVTAHRRCFAGVPTGLRRLQDSPTGT